MITLLIILQNIVVYKWILHFFHII